MTGAAFRNMFRTTAIILAAIGAQAGASGSIPYPGMPPEEAQASVLDGGAVLKNNLLEASYRWDAAGFSLVFRGLTPETDAATGNTLFNLKLADGRIVDASDFQVQGDVERVPIAARPEARRLTERFAGWQVRVPLQTGDGGIAVLFTATLRDASNYVRHEVSITSKQEDLAIDALTLLDLKIPDANLMGDTLGAPVVAGRMFFAFEHPMSESSAEDGSVVCGMKRGATLKAGTPLKQSCVLGVTPPGQVRRGFLYYVERERAHPYRPFLHYNSWYDIAWGDRKFNEAQALQAITLWGEELTAQRGVPLQSFVFDDGWDDNSTLWRFHEGFPDGFAPLREKAAQYGSAIGTWLSPFGGYGEAREQRLAFGRQQGFETNDSGFSMAGPRYYARYKSICEEMIRLYGVNFFKYDGMGAGLGAGGRGNTEYLEDIEALMRLMDELRAIEPNLYISATTGTWPSPYFLWHADNIWRGADDMGFSGQGSKRQQWINYRDTWTCRNIVQKGPLYPLNALMTQGIVQACHGMAAELGDSLQEMADEIWSFFGSGTSLQELYISPALLTADQWDVLAAAATWAKSNAAVLVDTHWVGGDPGGNEVYGWASWTPDKAILVLRNPANQNKAIIVEPAAALELPEGSPGRYRMSTPRPDQRSLPVQVLNVSEPCTFELKPFEVLVYELVPEH